MVLHASGTIFASQIMSEYNRNTSGTFFLGSSGRPLDSRVPQSGAINFSSFYNKYSRPQTGNLRVWLDAKEYSGSGTTWTDLQGNANGTLVNAPSFSRPYFNFNGTSQYVTLPDIDNTTDFTTSNNYTISCWVWVSSSQNFGDVDIVEKWAGSGGYPYVLRFAPANKYVNTAAYNPSPVSNPGVATANNSIIVNDWNHLSAVFNWSTLTISISVNGVLSVANIVANPGTINNSSLLYLMARGNPTNYVNGRLGMLMIHNIALNGAEVSRMYYATRNIFEIDTVELENGTWNVMYEYINPKRNASSALVTSKSVSGLGIYPPTSMTSDSTNITGQTYGNGTYVSSASSVNNTTYEQAFRAFDGAELSPFGGQTFWRCANDRYVAATGIYQGSVTTVANGVTYSGEWLQLQLPVAIVLRRFSITPRQIVDRADVQSPRSFVVLGSNNGSTWNLLHQENNINNWSTATKEWNTSGVNTAYSYYRLVISRVGNYDSGSTLQLAVNIETWQLFEYNTINRIGYFMQNNMGNGSTMYWIFVTMDAYTSTLSQLNIPDLTNIFTNQRNVTNLRIYSNHPQVGHYHAANGRLEIWARNYGEASNLGGGSGATYDFDDTVSATGDYGSVQVHDITNSKTLLAWNRHRQTDAQIDIGIGNNDISNIHYTGAGGQPDWTFANNGNYNWKFQVLIGTIPIEPTTMETGTWRLLYELTNPMRNADGMLVYAKNNAALLGDRQFTKVGYYMQNNMNNGATTYYAYVTMDAYTTSLRDLKIPDNVDTFINQRNVSNLNVYSNHPQVGTYSAANGRLEIWPYNYAQATTFGDGSAATYDFDDTPSIVANGHGSVQVHDLTNSKTVLAWNRHGNGRVQDIGFGTNNVSNIHYVAGAGLDWTEAVNGAYNWTFQVYIKI